jgi:adenosylmethionine-8-amino-7-oxononanoate aminotransferase
MMAVDESHALDRHPRGHYSLKDHDVSCFDEQMTNLHAAVEGAERAVRHFATDWEWLDSAYPHTYPRRIVRGYGAYLTDDTGHITLDAGAHLGVCQIGHGRRDIASAVAHQLAELDFVGLEAGYTHPLVASVATRLRDLLPLEDPVISLCSSGSEANDLAFKLARAYHKARGNTGRFKIVSRVGSYHGATYGGLSATGHVPFREPFEPVVPGFIKTAHPSPGLCGFCQRGGDCTLRCADALEETILAEGPETVAAFIGEPVSIFQTIKVPDDGYWPRIRDICDEYGVLLIADEVVTGFGRTGRMFASERFRIRPDIVTMAKGITSGYVPMGATAVSSAVDAVLRDVPLMHINTFAGHPAACAAALANLDILESEQLVQNAAHLESKLQQSLERVRASLPNAYRANAAGLLGCVEFTMEKERGDFAMRLRHALYESGLSARVGVGDGTAAVLFYPPLMVTGDEVEQGVAIIGDVLAAADARVWTS